MTASGIWTMTDPRTRGQLQPAPGRRRVQLVTGDRGDARVSPRNHDGDNGIRTLPQASGGSSEVRRPAGPVVHLGGATVQPHRIIDRRGHVHHVLVASTRLLDETGAVVGADGFYVDVTGAAKDQLAHALNTAVADFSTTARSSSRPRAC